LSDGDLRGARAAAEEAVRQAPSSARAHLALGKAIEAAEGAGTALASYQKSVAMAPLDAAAHYQLAMAYRTMGNPEKARAELALHEQYRERISVEDDLLLRELQERHAGADMWIRLGKSLLEQGDLQNAERYFRRALQLDRNAGLAHANLIAVYGGMGRWTDAEAAYRKAAVDPGNWQAHFNYGILKFRRREYKPAEEALRLVIAANPKDVDAFAALAASLAKLNRTREAEEHYKRALALQPESPLANALWGEHVLEAGRAEAAIDPLLRAALVPSANAQRARSLLTNAYMKAGGAERSAAIVKRALDRARASASPALVEAIRAEWTQLQQNHIPQ
jgi:Tfp pilus assembly protein PilF